jgi:hypothetical protein
MRYSLDRVGIKKTRLTIDYYVANDLVSKLIFKLFKQIMIKNSYARSLKNLDAVVSELRIPSAMPC